MASLRPRYVRFTPQKRTFGSLARMSAKSQKRTFRDSLDQFVGALLEVKRNVESERLGSLEIDRQLVLVRRLHWQIGWLLALEDMVNVTSRAAVLIDNIGSIGDQPAAGDEETLPVDRGQLVPGRERDDQLAETYRSRA